MQYLFVKRFRNRLQQLIGFSWFLARNDLCRSDRQLGACD